jgi:hypothetical protein
LHTTLLHDLSAFVKTKKHGMVARYNNKHIGLTFYHRAESD